jgi:hypothetical protein
LFQDRAKTCLRRMNPSQGILAGGIPATLPGELHLSGERRILQDQREPIISALTQGQRQGQKQEQRYFAQHS